MDVRKLRGVSFAVGLAAAALPIAWGFSRMAGVGGSSFLAGFLYGLVTVVAGSVLAAGLILCSSKPRLGITLTAAGAIAVSLLWFWILFITVPVGIVLIAVAYSRARDAGWPSAGSARAV